MVKQLEMCFPHKPQGKENARQSLKLLPCLHEEWNIFANRKFITSNGFIDTHQC